MTLLQAKLPNRFGEGWKIVAFHGTSDVAVVKQPRSGFSPYPDGVPVRVHSECVTGDVFGSLRCDCRDQLERSMDMIEAEGIGIVLYLRQEGRGIGITGKVAAYALQEHGRDTYEANTLLGFQEDERTYGGAVAMLKAIIGDEIRIRLLTNNPDKVSAFTEAGFVVSVVPLRTAANPHNAAYIETKRSRGR